MKPRLKIAVNAVNIKVAGGLAVTLNFLKVVKTSMPDVELDVLCPDKPDFKPYAGKNIRLQFIPKYMESPMHRLWADHVWLRKKIKQLNPDVIFTMANMAIPSSYRQAVLFMLPYAIYLDDQYIWQLQGTKDRWTNRLVNTVFRARLKYADIVFPQTETSLSRLRRFYPEIKKFEVISMAYSTLGKAGGETSGACYFKKENGYRYLLCLTRYYIHKNVEIFISLAKLIRQQNAPYKIITTLNVDQCHNTTIFFEQVKNEGLEDIIINLGNIPINEVPALYRQVDALLLPTLLESFSATYLDSFYYRKPVFTSDRDFAKDVCADAAYYFDPLSAQSILSVLDDAYSDAAAMEQKTTAGYERMMSLPDWDAVAEKYIEQLELLCKNRP